MNYRSKNGGEDPEWYTVGLPQIQCEARVASYLPTSLFMIAIVINATRWFHLI